MTADTGLPLYEKYADQILNSFANDMENKYQIYCCGSGGRMPNDIEELTMGFVAYRPASIEEARELEIFVTEELVNRINDHEKIRPFLREYPFTRNRVCIFIAFEKKDGSCFSKESIAYVSHTKDRIKYKKNDFDTDQYVDFYEEPYDEAVRILREGDSSKIGSK